MNHIAHSQPISYNRFPVGGNQPGVVPQGGMQTQPVQINSQHAAVPAVSVNQAASILQLSNNPNVAAAASAVVNQQRYNPSNMAPQQSSHRGNSRQPANTYQPHRQPQPAVGAPQVNANMAPPPPHQMIYQQFSHYNQYPAMQMPITHYDHMVGLKS